MKRDTGNSIKSNKSEKEGEMARRNTSKLFILASLYVSPNGFKSPFDSYDLIHQ